MAQQFDYFKLPVIRKNAHYSLTKSMNMLTAILCLAAIIIFALLYKFIEWFEKM